LTIQLTLLYPKEKYTQKDIENLFKKTKQGRKYTTVPIHAPGETENGKSNQPFKFSRFGIE
jgi:adenine-specific DNA-methyltransferase